MNEAPLPPSLRLRGAADVESDLEPRLSSADQSQVLARLRHQREVEHLCKTPRLVAELLAEIGRRHAIEDGIAARLQRYAGLDPEVLRAVGGDRFPPAPLWDVSRVSR